MLKTYQGGCHCGALRFGADLDLSLGTGKCNCSFCTRARLWSAQARPEAFCQTKGQEDLTDYRGSNPVAHHLFCRPCGVRPSEQLDMPNMTGHRCYNINPACLEGVDLADLLSAPIQCFDGSRNIRANPPAETRHL